MLYKDILDLIAIEVYKDQLQQEKKREIKRQVYCDKKSLSQTEFFLAGQQGLIAQHVFIVRLADYNGESIVMYNSIKYNVYRVYEKGEFIELYTNKKVGV